jgi:hypothetical protein
LTASRGPAIRVAAFLAIAAFVAAVVLFVLFVITFPVAAAWGAKPSGGMKVLMIAYNVLIFPGWAVRSVVGSHVLVASSMIWGLTVASICAAVARWRPATRPRIKCEACRGSGFTSSGSLATVCSGCRGLGWQPVA